MSLKVTVILSLDEDSVEAQGGRRDGVGDGDESASAGDGAAQRGPGWGGEIVFILDLITEADGAGPVEEEVSAGGLAVYGHGQGRNRGGEGQIVNAQALGRAGGVGHLPDQPEGCADRKSGV